MASRNCYAAAAEHFQVDASLLVTACQRKTFLKQDASTRVKSFISEM